MNTKKYAYHVTSKNNLQSILKYGLIPKIPTDYGVDGDVCGVYLFKTKEDVVNALYNWLGERIEEIEHETNRPYNEITLKIDITGLELDLFDSCDYEYTCLCKIEPKRIIEILEI